MTLISKTIPFPTESFTIANLNDSHETTDRPNEKILTVNLIESVPQQLLVISGDDYDSLGQWNDASLNAYIMAKFNLVPA